MRWSDQGIILACSPYGESKAIVSLLTKNHGRCKGLISLSSRHFHHIGEKVSAQWSGRLETQLGYYKLELEQSFIAFFLHDALRLEVLRGICALMEFTPERALYPSLYDALLLFLESICEQAWLKHFVRLEIAFLKEMGYGLDLSRCVVTGEKQHLVYLSPKTGKALTEEGAGKWKHRLLPLPSFLLSSAHDKSKEKVNDEEIIAGFHLTEHFLNKHFQQQNDSLSPLFWHAHRSVVRALKTKS